MTRDEFFRLACAAGYSTQWHSTGDAPMRQEMFGGELETARLMRFAELVAAAIRARCEPASAATDEPEASELAADIRYATHALRQAERKLRHLAPHYHGRSARELYQAAELAAAAAKRLEDRMR